MPPPKRSPRLPVAEEKLPIPNQSLSGDAISLDGGDIQIGETALRLFGIVTPQLSAPLGLQARTALDRLLQGRTVNCHIRDRDRDGHLLATCLTNDSLDLGQQLLTLGLALVARGSVQNTDVAQRYNLAEQEAGAAQRGLWANSSVATVLPPDQPQPHPSGAPAQTQTASQKQSLSKLQDTGAIAPALAAAASPPVTASAAPAAESSERAGWLERYQTLIAALIVLGAAAAGLFAAFKAHRVALVQAELAQRHERQILAAALHAELAAALDICESKAQILADPVSMDTKSYWPRLRTTLYQAHIGRIGLLGPTLARRVASVYGQMGDYSSMQAQETAASGRFAVAANAGPAITRLSVQKALEQLARQIKLTLAGLMTVESSGLPLPPPQGGRTQPQTPPQVKHASTQDGGPGPAEPVPVTAAPPAKTTVPQKPNPGGEGADALTDDSDDEDEEEGERLLAQIA